MAVLAPTIQEHSFDWRGKPGVRHATVGLVVHHTAEAAGSWDAARIHRHHRDTNGWAGIGYHFVALPDGTLERGRPEAWIGAHAPRANATHLAVCLPGEFSGPRRPSEAQQRAVAHLWAWLSECYGWGFHDRSLTGHRDYSQTACPGDNLYALLGSIRDRGRELAEGSGRAVVEWPGIEPIEYVMVGEKACIGVRELAEKLGHQIDVGAWPTIRVV